MKKLVNEDSKGGITLIALVITIIVLLILAGVTISTLTGENGILTKAQKSKELTEISSEEEFLNLLIVEYQMDKKTYGKKLERVAFNTLDDTTSIYDSETGITYEDGWYYLIPSDVNDYDFKNSYIINYDTGDFLRYEENKHRIVTNTLLCIKEGLVYSADPKNMTGADSWGDAILHNFNEGDENSGWSENALMFDGVDDGIEVKDNSDYSKGITLEIYFNSKGQGSSNMAHILMMKRTSVYNGFFMHIAGKGASYGAADWYNNNEICIDIGGSNQRFSSGISVQKNVPMYVTYTFDNSKEEEKGVLYINGIKSKVTNAGNIENLKNTPENTPIQIGSDIYETYGNAEGYNRKYPFYGDIYASRVYNRPLTEKEVEYNYNMTVNNN